MTTTAKRFDLLMLREVEHIRKCSANVIVRQGRPTFDAYPTVQYGTPELKTATGRGRCRCCGQKIAKGAKIAKFYYDFSGCGSWTAVEVQMHLDACPEVPNV